MADQYPSTLQQRLLKISEFFYKQCHAALFGILLLGAILITHYYYPADSLLSRNDFLSLFAIMTQALLIKCGYESWREARVILLFHIVGTVMELFKTSVGSWQYAQAGYLFIGHVPLYTGFMYASVGSYMMKLITLYDLRFRHYPPRFLTIMVAVAIYLNFFTHHYMWDCRWLILAIVAWLYWRTEVYIKVGGGYYGMPILIGFFAIALLIWLAENIGTVGGMWLYPNQLHEWHWVSLQKVVAWFLLLLISAVLVMGNRPPKAPPKSIRRELRWR